MTGLICTIIKILRMAFQSYMSFVAPVIWMNARYAAQNCPEFLMLFVCSVFF